MVRAASDATWALVAEVLRNRAEMRSRYAADVAEGTALLENM